MTQPKPTTPTTAAAPPPLPVTLLAPAEHKRPSKSIKLLRAVRTAFRSFPILTPATCRLPSHLHLRGGGGGGGAGGHHDGHIHGAARTTGTLYGRRKARITLAIQDNPRTAPLVLLELNVPTAKFMQEMGSSGLVRVALECEKKAADKTRLLDEPVWTSFVNGRSIGYATRREANATDLSVMQVLHAVSMGAGVLPGDPADAAVDGELTYMRAHFDRVVGSRDSETFYMLNPDGNSSPELSVFFVRI